MPAPDPAAVSLHYDELDDAYRQIWSEHAHHGFWWSGRESVEEAVAALVDLAADAALVGPGSRLVDLGSGYGATGRQLARRGALTTSVTISQRQHDYARAADGDDPRLVQLLRPWAENGLEAGAYDAVIAIESLNHLETGPALAEVVRVLRPGGRVVVCDLVAGDGVPRWQRGPLLRRMEEESHLIELPTIAGFTSRFAAAGLVVDEARDLTRGVRGTWPRGIARLLRTLRTDPEFRRQLFAGQYENDGFVASLVRMTAGLRLGAVRYYLVSAHKPDR
jgi:cyclopropane fatty-acyl-phospholipid synthase-like methyltransferase